MQFDKRMERRDFFLHTSLAFFSLVRFGTVTFELSPAFLLTHTIVKAGIWGALA